MAHYLTPLKELYAKGEKVWEYANEWDRFITNDSSSGILKLYEHGSYLYYCSQKKLIQMDKSNGDVIWEMEFDESPKGVNFYFTANDNYIYVYKDDFVYIVDNSGSVFQKLKLERSVNPDSLGLAIDENERFYISNKYDVLCYEKTDGMYSQKWEWSKSGSGSTYMPICYYKQYLYAGENRSVNRFDVKTGSVVSVIDNIDSVHASAFVFIDKVCFTSNMSVLSMINPDTMSVQYHELLNTAYNINVITPFVDGNRFFYLNAVRPGTPLRACISSDLSQQSGVLFDDSPIYIAGGSNSHIYYMNENKKISKRKLTKYGGFNLASITKNGGLLNGNID